MGMLRWHLTGWGVGMLEVAPDRMGCGNVGGGTDT